ncbi:MAG: ABC transporter permease, partial [Anaerolineae bacterium]
LLLKDKGARAVLFLMPLIQVPNMAAPTATMRDMQETSPEGEPAFSVEGFLVNQDPGVYGGQIATALQGLSMLDLTVLDSVDEADQAVAAGDRPVAIVLPADFSQKIEANEPATVQLIADPTQAHLVNLVTGIVNQAVAEVGILAELQYGIREVLAKSGVLEEAGPALQEAAQAQVLGVIWTQVQEMRQNPLITVRHENLEGEESTETWDPFAFFVPGSSVMFAFFIMPFIASALLREKERGSFRRLLASPIRHSSIIGGTMLAYSVIVFLQVILLFTVGALAFDMPLGDSPLGLVLTTLITALAATSLGLLLGALAKTSKQADNLGVIAGFVLMFLGGCIMPLYNAEGFIGILSKLTPHAHALQAYRGIMVDSLPLVQVLPSLGILAIFAAVFFALAVWRFKFE